ncbi:MAG: hypothetical protein H6797_00655 [Candidatus Nomurabacteria bacterium]|nr:MAG: hypothetical protein H6797_00655 [Candidatus Nomurabacteria bacterium]
MDKEKPNPIREDLGYDLPPSEEMTLDQAKALHAQGLGGKKAERIVKREQDRQFFDSQHGVDSTLPPLTPEEVERSHRGHALASEALKRAKEKKKDD